jgi:hypothetical protein
MSHEPIGQIQRRRRAPIVDATTLHGRVSLIPARTGGSMRRP